MPAEQHQGAIAYVSGGVGQDEARAFENAAASYPLTLEFVASTRPRDEFLADVHVTISDARGNPVLNTTAEGPFLLVKLPSGRYHVRATYLGKSDERAVDVGATDHHRLLLQWPA